MLAEKRKARRNAAMQRETLIGNIWSKKKENTNGEL